MSKKETLLAILALLLFFNFGRLYQVNKDKEKFNVQQEQFIKLNEKYVDVCENSVYIGKKE